MPQIKILPDILTNQIAAGEVVERPASIVKELIENSLDANASKITIKFKNGGKNFIIIEDNGCGMDPQNASLCPERHATSKIENVDDLNTITTFGFRGEAIPSIASVSRFTLKTRSESHPTGTEILINGGKYIYQKDIGMSPGTTIEVANLFNSIPARRKFLKTESTESAHIVHTVRLYALSFPSVSFTLFENDRLIFKTNPTRNLLERINDAWSQKIGSDLLPLEAQEGSLKLSGFIGSPNLYRSTKHELLTFVNNRPVDSKTLYYAFTESYHTHIPKGRYPVVFAFLEIYPSLIDVNVHPAKREIKFKQEPIVRQFIIQNVLKALSNKMLASNPTQNTPISKKFNSDLAMKSFSDTRVEGFTNAPPSKPIAPLTKPSILPTKSPFPKAEPSTLSCTALPPDPFAPASFQPSSINWRVLNILQNGYGLLESHSSIIIFNYRGAHHRVCYEKLLKEFHHQALTVQPLLIPIPLELTNLENEAFLKGKKLFEKLGFTLAPFGRNYHRIESVPVLLQNADIHKLVKSMIGLLQEEGGNPLKHAFIQKIIQLSSYQAITTTNIPTDSTVILNLLEQLMQCNNPLSCPRGYPIYSETTYSELDKRFGR